MSQTTVQAGYLPVNRGEYVAFPETRYYKDNVVQYYGSSYIADPTDYDPVSNPEAYVTSAPYTNDPTTLNTGWRVFADAATYVENKVGEIGVFDISSHNLSGSPLAPTKYASLTAALGTSGAHVPEIYQRGGMMVKFINSSTNKYEQYRLKATSFSTTESDWVNIEKEKETLETKVDGLIYDVSKENSGVVFESLSELLSSGNLSTLIPTSIRTGGMTIRFVRTSDNKYVQYWFVLSEFSVQQFTSISHWKQVGVEDGFINVNIYNNKTTAYDTVLNAHIAVPTNYRKPGLIVDYLLSDGWHKEQYIGTDTDSTSWTTETNWKSLEVVLPSISSNKLQLEGSNSIIEQDIINVNNYNNRTSAYSSIIDAIVAITSASGLRIRGQIITFLMADGWHTLQFEGNPSTEWTDILKWKNIGNAFCAIGNDNTAITNSIQLQKKHLYRIVFSKLWDLTNVTGNVIAINYKSQTVTKSLLSVPSSETIELAYTFYVPDDIIDDNEGNVVVRGKSGEIISYTIEDVTGQSLEYTTNKLVNSFLKEIYTDLDLSNVDSVRVYKNNLSRFGIGLYDSTNSQFVGRFFYEQGTVPSDTMIFKEQNGHGYIFADISSFTDGSYNGFSAKFITQVNNILECPVITSYLDVNKQMLFNPVIRIAASNSSTTDKQKADFVCTGTGDDSIINSCASKRSVIILSQGTYTLSSFIKFTTDYVAIIGEGNVTINRSAGACIINREKKSHITISNIILGSNVNLFTSADCIDNHIVKCSINGIHYNHIHISGQCAEMSIGQGMDVDSLVDGYNYVSNMITIGQDGFLAKSGKLLIYGHIVTELTSGFDVVSHGISFVGMTKDATLEFQCAASVGNAIIFRDTDYYGRSLFAEYKDLRFLMTGEMDSWNKHCVSVVANNLKFINCVFENATTSPISYDPQDEEDMNVPNVHGDRRHGILININADTVENDKLTEFISCVGIGSPYGFKNVRGWYIMSGRANLINCVGIGGGIGKNGYGFVLHRRSNCYLYNCVGYGSPIGWNNCNGFNFQGASQNILYNCIGYGGRGYKHKSNGGTDLITLTELTGASHGFSPIHNATPKMVDCIGYAGDGEGSFGFKSEGYSVPIVQGGLFGKELLITSFTDVTLDSGEDYITTPLQNKDRAIDVESVYVSVDVTQNPSQFQNTKFQILVNGNVFFESANNISNENVYIMPTTRIAANAVITCKFLDTTTGTGKSMSGANIDFKYMVANSMNCLGIYANSSPFIHKATFVGNKESDGISIETTSNKYLVDGCSVNIPVTKKAVKSSTSKDNVRIVDCLFTSDITENINSFATTTSIGSNKKI